MTTPLPAANPADETTPILNSAGERALLAMAADPLQRIRLSFTAFRRLPGGKAQRLNARGASLAEVVASALLFCTHKDTFLIRATDPVSRKTIVHAYAVKRKSQGRWIFVDQVSTKVHDLYDEPLFDMEMAAFDPVEPWGWEAGADVVGIDRSVVGGRVS